ncbi:MAG TPA: hypothetical protein VFL94_06955 [Actinomycetales bacterium]|nr:hypothetical protein [Actinomycetales bacterium]
MTTATAPARREDWMQAWTDALTVLELDVAACERLLHAVHTGAELPGADGTLGSWVPPTSIGPLPETLQERARTVLARQLDVAQALAVAATRSRQQLDFADRVQTGRSPARPVYVDAAF